MLDYVNRSLPADDVAEDKKTQWLAGRYRRVHFPSKLPVLCSRIHPLSSPPSEVPLPTYPLWHGAPGTFDYCKVLLGLLSLLQACRSPFLQRNLVQQIMVPDSSQACQQLDTCLGPRPPRVVFPGLAGGRPKPSLVRASFRRTGSQSCRLLQRHSPHLHALRLSECGLGQKLLSWPCLV
ncbi:hypothetical protein BJX99DRAFT_229070 [Aspergillus californicus]